MPATMLDPAPFVAWLQGVLPAGCGVAGGPIDPLADADAGEDREGPAGRGSRRMAFRCGRRLACAALRSIGRPAGSIPTRAWGDPQWPPGIVGSITHVGGLAFAAVGPAERVGRLGIDADTDAPLDVELVGRVCYGREREPDPILAAAGIDRPKLTFVAKEAWYKAVCPTTPMVFDLADARMILDARAMRFRMLGRSGGGASGSRAHGRLFRGGGLLGAAVFDGRRAG